MRALVYSQYGSPDQLSFAELPKPDITDNQVLLKVRAVSLNASDVEFLTGTPAYARIAGLRKPRLAVLGSDVCGEIVALGKKVSQFQMGDIVYGDVLDTRQCLAEYVAIPADKLQLKPTELSDEQAANLPQASTVGFQSINFDQPIRAGERVLIVGAGGGSGCFAIQLSKLAGAHVTAVDNQHKLTLMQRLGADVVIDYAAQDYTDSNEPFDRIVDFVGSHSLKANRSVLSPKGRYCIVGGPLRRLLNVVAQGAPRNLISDQTLGVMMHQQSLSAINDMAQKIIQGHLELVAEPPYAFENAIDAFRHHHAGKALGKVCITFNKFGD